MSVAGLAGFVQGFAGQRQDQKDRAERAANAARQDRYIDAMGAIPQGGMASGGGGPMGGMGAMPAPVQGHSSGGNAGMGPAQANSGLFGLIDAVEGGGNYSTLFGHSQNGGRFDGVDVAKMSLGELYDFSNPSGEYGQWVAGANPKGVVATPMGRHQIVGTTLRAAASEMGLPPTTVFTPQVQDSIATHLAAKRLARATSPAAKRAALRAEWDGFSNVSDAALDSAIAQFQSGEVPQRPMGATNYFTRQQ